MPSGLLTRLLKAAVSFAVKSHGFAPDGRPCLTVRITEAGNRELAAA
jgi:hypothetical protein